MGTDARTRQAYRFALDPTEAQKELLGSLLGAYRFFFNWGLALVKGRLDQRQAGLDVRVPWSYKALCSEFAKVKDQVAPWRREVVVGSQQAGLEALGAALQRFSGARTKGKRVGFPRFRAKGRSHEAVIFQRPRIRDSRHLELDRRLGPLRTREPMLKLVRLLERDPKARILRSTVSRSASGKWFVSFQVERSQKRRRARRPEAAVGVDLGIRHLATLSSGEALPNSRPLEQALRRLRRLTKQLERQRQTQNPHNYRADGRVRPGANQWKRSRRMLRTEAALRRLHERVANLRREQAHQLTTHLSREFGIIGVESLRVRNLMANRRLARRISDAGWGEILRQLAYKTSWSEGSLLVSAEPFYPSSKRCSRCGTVKAKLSLQERIFICAGCGHVKDRDLNAALNLAQIAQQHAQADGIPNAYVAQTDGETLNARRGQVSLIACDEHSPLKREGSIRTEPSQRREAPAVAAR